MRNTRMWLVLILIISTLLAACEPSAVESDALATQIAQGIFATQTAQVLSDTPVPAATETQVPTDTLPPTAMPSPSFTPEPTRSPTPPPTLSPSPTPSWQNYYNYKQGFSIQYPGGWVFQEEQAYTAFLSNVSSSWVTVSVFNSIRDQQSLINDAIADEIVLDRGMRTINGLEWDYGIYQTADGTTIIDMYAFRDPNGMAFIFMGASNPGDHSLMTEVFVKMLESLEST